MRWRNLFSLIAALAVLASGCGRNTVKSPLSQKLTGPGASLASLKRPATTTGTQVATGAVGPGAHYNIWVPEDWNGDLVVYAHGYTPPCAPVSVPNISALRDLLLARKLAVAASSYSENGYALAEGARQTHQLRGVFAEHFGDPQRTFILGVSLGGIIGLKLAETFPGVYDGALLVSGVVGGTKAQVQYVGDVWELFDCLYPGALPSGLVTDERPCTFPLPAIAGAIQGNPGNLQALFCMVPWLPAACPARAGESVLNVLGLGWIGGADFFDRTHGHQLYDNDDRTYHCPLLPGPVNAAINACVTRYSSTPAAEAFMRNNYEPSGNVRIPVLTLHNTCDPVVPIQHEALYRAKVEQAGRLQWLLQRTDPDYGHVTFSAQELAEALDDLIDWVDSGTKPPA